MNLFAGLQHPDGRWSITAFAKNILDQQQVLNVGAAPLTAAVRAPTQPGGFINYTSEYRSVSVTAPREFGIQARIALGSR